MNARLTALEKERQRLADELAAARKENGMLSKRVKSLEGQLTDRDRELASLRSGAGDKDKLAADLGASKQRVAELEHQLVDRDKELAGLRGDLSSEMAKLKEVQRGIVKALHPQIDKGNIMVDLNNQRLLINLASGYLFGSGEDQLKPAGADALKQVGGILKDFPEYKVAVDGHTDNRPIRSSLKKKFPADGTEYDRCRSRKEPPRRSARHEVALRERERQRGLLPTGEAPVVLLAPLYNLQVFCSTVPAT